MDLEPIPGLLFHPSKGEHTKIYLQLEYVAGGYMFNALTQPVVFLLYFKEQSQIKFRFCWGKTSATLKKKVSYFQRMKIPAANTQARLKSSATQQNFTFTNISCQQLDCVVMFCQENIASAYFRQTAFRTWVKVKQVASMSVTVTNRQAPQSFFWLSWNQMTKNNVRWCSCHTFSPFLGMEEQLFLRGL